MTTLIELTPTHRGGWPVPADSELSFCFELACEYVESIGSRPFSKRELFLCCYSMSAVRQLIKFFTALNFIERVSEPGAKPTLYRVLPHALPRQVAA